MKIALKFEDECQTCPLIFDLQNQVRYITTLNCIKVSHIVFMLHEILSQGQQSQSNITEIYEQQTHISTKLYQFFIVECGITHFLSVMCVFEVRASSSSPRLPLCQILFLLLLPLLS